MDSNHNKKIRSADILAEEVVGAFKKKYLVIGRGQVTSWKAWLVIGIMAGITTGVAFVASNTTRPSGIAQVEFETTKAAEIILQAPHEQSEFSSNEILVKIKKSEKDKIKEGNPEDTGISSLNEVHKKHKVKSLEQLAKKGVKSDSSHDLFSWYKITLDAPQEIIKGKFNHKTGIIEFSDTKEIAPKIEFQKLLPNSNSSSLQQLISELKNDPNIEEVDLNYIVHTTAIPNDPYYSSKGSWGQPYDDLWGLKKINAASAWEQTKGSASIIVADIDTGVDRNHEDLTSNMWVNTSETPSNGVDDDSNGYIDDYYGWDWANNDNDPMDDNGHGTHTVGTIAAVGNNGIGVVGVNWTSKIMALKYAGSNGSGSSLDGIKALQYAADNGAKVSSNSWGGVFQSSALDDAIKYAHNKGTVIVAGAGNNNGDALDFSPASSDYAITVAASDSTDAKPWFSNWGEKIDVAAPGVDILSLKAAMAIIWGAIPACGNYCRASGTSMATPHVAGLAALLLAKNPTLTNEEIRQIIRNGADDLGSPGKDSSFGYGRINAAGSMNLATTHPFAPIITTPKSRSIIFGTSYQIFGSTPGPNFASYKIEAGLGRSPTTWSTIASSTTQVTNNGVLATVDTSKINDGVYIFRLTATDTLSKIYQFQVHDVEVDNIDAVISSPVNPILSRSGVNVAGTALTKNGAAFVNYKLEWGIGSSPASWSTTGISLNNGGIQPVSNGNLGTWDTSSLSLDQDYSLRLTVNSNSAYQTTTNVVAVSSIVYNFVTKWGTNGSGDGQFSFPTGIATDSSGNVYVADNNNSRIQKFTSTGVFITKWGILGSSDGHFSSPFSLAVDLSNNLYVADSNNSRIQKFTSTGVFITKWGILGSGDGQLNAPAGIVVDSNNNVYVSDTGNSRIQKFTSEGVFITKWGTNGSGDGQFSSPRGIATDSSGNVYVADSNNSRIQKFTSTGVFITKWGILGSGSGGQFSAPFGIATDSSGNVYVADSSNSRIQKFTSTGVFITKWGILGSGDGEFLNPRGIATDSSGNVYVADSSNSRIQKFSPTRIPPCDSYGDVDFDGFVTSNDCTVAQTLFGHTVTTEQERRADVDGNNFINIFDISGICSYASGGQNSFPVCSIDTTKPTVSITSPLNGTTVPRKSAVTIAATASDNVGITKVEFYVNGSLTCTDTTLSYNCSWSVPRKTKATYTIQAKAYDAAGNTATHSVSVTAK